MSGRFEHSEYSFIMGNGQGFNAPFDLERVPAHVRMRSARSRSRSFFRHERAHAHFALIYAIYQPKI